MNLPGKAIRTADYADSVDADGYVYINDQFLNFRAIRIIRAIRVIRGSTFPSGHPGLSGRDN